MPASSSHRKREQTLIWLGAFFRKASVTITYTNCKLKVLCSPPQWTYHLVEDKTCHLLPQNCHHNYLIYSLPLLCLPEPQLLIDHWPTTSWPSFTVSFVSFTHTKNFSEIPEFRTKLSFFLILLKSHLHAIVKTADNLWNSISFRLFSCPFQFLCFYFVLPMF